MRNEGKEDARKEPKGQSALALCFLFSSSGICRCALTTVARSIGGIKVARAGSTFRIYGTFISIHSQCLDASMAPKKIAATAKTTKPSPNMTKSLTCEPLPDPKVNWKRYYKHASKKRQQSPVQLPPDRTTEIQEKPSDSVRVFVQNVQLSACWDVFGTEQKILLPQILAL